MKYLNRLILILLLALLMVVSLVLTIYSFGLVGEQFLGEWQQRLYGNVSAAISFIVIFVLSSWSLYPLFRRKTGTANISTTEDGQVNISLRAINKIMREVAYQEESVDVRSTEVDAREDGLYARLSISVQEDDNIPALTGRLQHKIKSRLHNITGASVSSIEILIENVEENRKTEDFVAREAAEEPEEDIVEDTAGKDQEEEPELEDLEEEESEDDKGFGFVGEEAEDEEYEREEEKEERKDEEYDDEDLDEDDEDIDGEDEEEIDEEDEKDEEKDGPSGFFS